MRIIQINYDLKAPGRNYQPVYDWIKSHPWAHPLESCWLIKTSQETRAVLTALQKLVDSNDELLVMDVTNDEWWTNLPDGQRTAVRWLYQNMTQASVH